MPKLPMIGNIVREYNISKTKVKICDDYCKNKSPEEVEEILRRISGRALKAFQSYRKNE